MQSKRHGKAIRRCAMFGKLLTGSLCLAFVLIAAFPVHAQFDTAVVLGTIRDATGAVVPGAAVTLRNVDTGISSSFVSDENGGYQFLDVKIGAYRVEAAAAGFTSAVVENFRVTVNARQRVDLVLTVGPVTQEIAVTGTVNLLETETSDRGQLVEREQVIAFPLNGRSYADLTLLTTGVRKGLRDDRKESYNVNGLRFEINNFQLDGIDNNAYATSNVLNSNQVLQISPDAIEEFRVQTNNYSAEYGR